MNSNKKLPPSLDWHNTKIKGAKRTRLIEERKKKSLTQKALAEKIGVSAATINHLENGRTKPSLMVSMSLQECFGLDDEILFPDH